MHTAPIFQSPKSGWLDNGNLRLTIPVIITTAIKNDAQLNQVKHTLKAIIVLKSIQFINNCKCFWSAVRGVSQFKPVFNAAY